MGAYLFLLEKTFFSVEGVMPKKQREVTYPNPFVKGIKFTKYIRFP